MTEEKGARKMNTYIFSVLCALCSALCFLASGARAFAQEVKECEFCGSFYPSGKTELESYLEELLGQATPAVLNGQILGVISPHAGYVYSAPVAAHSYKILKNQKFDTIIILAPSHRYYINGISIYPSGSFSVPNAKLRIDSDTAKEFASLAFAGYLPKYFYNEHSLEVQLPFIAKTLGNPKIVPIVFGKVDFEEMQKLADKLAEISKKKNILVVASSDLSHYLTYEEANKLDKSTLSLIKNEDVKALWFSEIQNEGRACGINPIITLLLYAQAKNAKIDILKYANSGDTAGDKSRVVGYLSAAVYIPN